MQIKLLVTCLYSKESEDSVFQHFQYRKMKFVRLYAGSQEVS